ncbi:MAG: hypothetical protein IT348_18615 [Candidatus Eisenbacteria bacterium]|nr:hypothetical protein [Candidatus Eisenbacteria bacterium]
MFGRVTLAGLLLAAGAATAIAAPFTAKVAVVNKQHVCLLITAEPEPWMKKGAKVRVFGGKAMIINIVADTICVTSPNAAKAKVGATVTLEKPRAGAAGC